MRHAPRITEVELTPAGPRNRHGGLLGWRSFRCGPFRLHGATQRRERSGRLSVSWPARTDRFGFRHAYFEAYDEGAKRVIEEEILGQLGFLRAENPGCGR